MKRIFLMNPPSGLYRRDDRCQSKVDDQTVRVVFPPIDLGVLASVARQCGAQVELKDYPTVGATREDYIRDIRRFEPDLILLNTTTHTIREDMEAFAIAREFLPGVRTVVKGEAVAVMGVKALADHPSLDIIIAGEPEETFRELVEDKPLEAIAGILWRDASGQGRQNPARALVEQLDMIPLPAYDLFDSSLYRSPENGRPITAIYAQRGCPSKCIFCPAGSMFGYKVRERSVENVLKEVVECVEVYGIRDFLFHGDTFTLHKKWLLELCQGIVERGLDIHWGCNSRVDTIDDERAAWMKRAGCWVVAFGFEHGVQEMLDKMKKGTRVERAYEAVEICRRNGLKVHGFFVVGLPWETEETLKQTYRFVRRLDLDFFDFNIAYPLPGTEYHEIACSEGLFEASEPSKGSYAQAAVRSHTLSSAQLTAWRSKALLRMYARPHYIVRTVVHAARAGTLTHYTRAALFRLKSLLRG